MKKRVLVIVALLLVLAMGTFSASAAVSPTAETAAILADAAASTDGDVDVLEQVYLADVLTFIEESAADIFDIPADVEEEVVPEVKAAFEFVPSTETTELLAAQGYVDVSFNVDVAEGSTVVILHWTGDDWEIIPAVVSNGVVTGRFTSFSPVVIIEYASETVDVAPVETPQGDAVAPQTGLVSSIVGLAAIGFAAAAIVTGKKSKKN